MTITLPAAFSKLDQFVDQFSVPILCFSILMLTFGWGLQILSDRTEDCHASGCTHPPCGPSKAQSKRILWGATLLFLLNLSVFIYAG